MSFPPIARVRRDFVQPEVGDVSLAVAQAIGTSRLAERLPAGGRVAITVGSRGIAGIAKITRGVVEIGRLAGI